MSDSPQPLSREEWGRGVEAVATWPKDKRAEILRLERNEQEWMLGLAGMLGARPESEGPAQK